MITIKTNPSFKQVAYKHFIFGGGEQNIQILDTIPAAAIIELNFSQDSDIIKLALITNALRIGGCKSIGLMIPYFPGARQDRVCNKGEALSVKVYADMINALKFDRVTIFDPHSDVTPALIDNVEVANNHMFVSDVLHMIIENIHVVNYRDIVFISPDAGSNKKIFDLAKKYRGLYPVVRADKLRDLATGKIIDMQVYATAEEIQGKYCVIIDDICSKGGTFCGLAKVLKQMGAQWVGLVVTHYEGTASPSILKESGIDHVYTTDSKPLSTPDPAFITRFSSTKYLF